MKILTNYSIGWQSTPTEGVYVYNTGKPGPTTGVMAGNHGDERAGVLVAQGLMQTTDGPVMGPDLIGELTEKEQACVERAAGYFGELEIMYGNVVVMLGNPLAIRARTRFYEGANINRWYRDLDPAEQNTSQLSYVQTRAQTHMRYMLQCHTLLDLHEYTAGRPFLIAERGPALAAARYLVTDPRTILSCNWNAIEPGGSDGYMFEHGRVGICFELGYKYRPEWNIQRGALAVRRLLDYQGQTSGAGWIEGVDIDPPLLEMTRAITYSKPPFKLAEPLKNFQTLRPGQLIASQGTGEAQEMIYASEDETAPEVILFPKRNPKLNTEAFCLGRYVAE